MPRKARKRTLRGKGIKEWFQKANNWLRKTGAISKVAGALGSVGLPYASAISSGAKALGYGKRRKRRTGGTVRGRGYQIAGVERFSPGLIKL